MAATLTVTDRYQLGGNINLIVGTIALDNSYPTGGEPIDSSSDENFRRLVMAGGGTAAQGLGYAFLWDEANQKLVVYWGNAGTAGVFPEVTNTTDLSALTTVPVIFLTY